MKKTMLGAAFLALTLSNAAHAEPDYDRTLEQAAMRIVAEKIGDLGTALRGTFDDRDDVAILVAPEQDEPAAESVVWESGLAPVIDGAAARNGIDMVSTGAIIR